MEGRAEEAREDEGGLGPIPLSATVKGSLSLSQRGAQGGLVIELCDLPWVSTPPGSFSSPSGGPMRWTVVVTKLHLLKLLDLYA